MSRKNVYLLFGTVFFVVFLFFRFANAQDTSPVLEAGKYTVAGSFPTDTDLAKVCAFRTDTRADLKCVTVGLNQVVASDNLSAVVTAGDGRKYKVSPPSSTGKVALIQDITLVNTGVDVRIGLRAEDTAGNSSESTNVAVVDFTPPAKPTVLNVTSTQ